MIEISTINIVRIAIISIMVLFYTAIPDSTLLNDKRNIQVSTLSSIVTISIGVLFIYLFGLRNYISTDSGDSFLYAYAYQHIETIVGPTFDDALKSREWAWATLLLFLYQHHIDVSGFFTIVSVLYMVPILYGCIKLGKSNSWILLLAFLLGITFMSNGMNGIRNGVACSIAFLGLLQITDHSKLKLSNFLSAVALCLIAHGIHGASVILIIPAFIVLFFIKSYKTALILWLSAIVLSLIFGNRIAFLVADFDASERALSYLQGGESESNMAKFAHSGFRLDFLLYSAIPIVVGYYISIVKKIHDRRYNILLFTYMLANAVWIIFIYAAYSNRFAMISWYLFPLTIIYPFISISQLGDFRIRLSKISIVGLFIFFFVL
ncbi:MAG: EpsG family protein [Bacteroidales bacterium]|nr:EpsG family protein [Bacteroidales bacterium]